MEVGVCERRKEGRIPDLEGLGRQTAGQNLRKGAPNRRNWTCKRNRNFHIWGTLKRSVCWWEDLETQAGKSI